MTFNFLVIFISLIIFLLAGYTIVKVFFKSKKMKAENIYKLIDDLEKKYIY